MSAPRARVASTTTIDTRQTLLILDEPIVGSGYAGADRPMLRHTIAKVLVTASREDGGAWRLGRVETRGDSLLESGEPSGLPHQRDYHPDPAVTGRGGFRYYHADMPTPLAVLVDETLDEHGDDPPTPSLVAAVDALWLVSELYDPSVPEPVRHAVNVIGEARRAH